MVQITLQALFRSTIAGVVVQGFRSSSVPVTHEGYLVKSRSPLRFGRIFFLDEVRELSRQTAEN